MRLLVIKYPEQAYYNFYRADMHEMLMEAATGPGAGEPAKLLHNHSCQSMDSERGIISFSNGVSVRHDLVIGADGIGVSYSANGCP